MSRLMIILVLILSGCRESDYGSAASTLGAMGFTEIKLKEPEFYSACGREDHVNHRFTAKNASGMAVSGTVCCGGSWSYKGCTVRF